MPLVRGGSVPYPPVSLESSDDHLTKRKYPWTEAEMIPRDRWSFARLEDGKVVSDPGRLDIEDGFQPGWLYELVYNGKDPKPTGLGMAAIRDVVAFFRYDRADTDGNANPLAGAIEHAYAWGHSQSARLLNHFVYEDFNHDETRRPVFDGILMNCGGGGKGQFNSRFAQMTRHGSHLEDNLALLTALDRWVSGGVEPPASQIPRIADGTLVNLATWKKAFPDIPGVLKPPSFYHPYRLDPGPRWQSEGIMDNVPPKAGRRYVCLVPQVDADGQEIAGVRLPEVAVPLATYTGWVHRNPAFSLTLGRNAGRVWPLARSAEEKERNHDPRPSIRERYPNSEIYLDAVTSHRDQLLKLRLILPEDHDRMLEQAAFRAGLIGNLRTIEELAAQDNPEAAGVYFELMEKADMVWWYGRSIRSSINRKGYELMGDGNL